MTPHALTLGVAVLMVVSPVRSLTEFQGAPQRHAIVVGQVVDRETGAGIRHPIVSLTQVAARTSASSDAAVELRVIGDNEGRFVFSGLAESAATVSAAADGY